MIDRNAEVKMMPCPHCHTDSRLDFSFYVRDYYRCPHCDLIFRHREKGRTDLLAYYQKNYFDEHGNDQTSGIRTLVYLHVLDVLSQYTKTGSLLDVGCGCGYFLKEAQDHGWQVTGIDPSEKSIEIAKTLIGDAALCGTLDDLPADMRFDAVTLINVLDHMVDGGRQLKVIRNLLKPGGVLYLRFPNGSFYTFILHLSRYLPSSMSKHMNNFLVFHEYAITARAIKHCLAELGFARIEVCNTRLSGDCMHGGNRSMQYNVHRSFTILVSIAFQFLESISRGRWVWGPSLQVTAIKPSGGHSS